MENEEINAPDLNLNSEVADIEKKEIPENEKINSDVKNNQNQDEFQLSFKNVIAVIEENNSMLKSIKDNIDIKLTYDETKEKAFDKLYEELRYAKERDNIKDSAIKPLLLDLLLFYDSLKKFKLKIENSKSNDEILQELDFILEEFTEILYRQEVQIIPETLDSSFDSKFQKSVKIENNEEIEDNKVVKITRSGFFWKDKMLRPQEVSINKKK